LVRLALEYHQSFISTHPLSSEVMYGKNSTVYLELFDLTDNGAELGFLPGHLEPLSQAEIDSDIYHIKSAISF
jgi:hypothetical protein